MSYQITCPGCQHPVALPDKDDGQRLRCAQCRTEFALQARSIPAQDEGAPAFDTAFVTAGSATGRPGAVFCVQCGTKYARTDDACPNCGQPTREPIHADSPDDWRLYRKYLPPIGGYQLVVGAILIPLGLLFLFGVTSFNENVFRPPRPMRTWITFFSCGTGILLELAAFAAFMRWLYQAWRLVLRGDEDYSPGLLVGLLFVPFFNFYWMFRAIPGLSLAVNQQLKAIVPTREHANGWGPGIAACLLALFPPAWPIAICMFLAWVFLTNHAINRLVRHHDKMRMETEPRSE